MNNNMQSEQDIAHAITNVAKQLRTTSLAGETEQTAIETLREGLDRIEATLRIGLRDIAVALRAPK
jgi:hypothetical protein